MGIGLVRSVDNFGQQGDRPTHPKLLDHLAADFIRGGWSIKRIVRRIALSASYRQSSAYRLAAFERDPENRWLWRMSRRRLDAEAIRDAMLWASGRLDGSPGQSPVRRLGRLAVDNNNQNEHNQAEQSLRRSVYLPLVRNDWPEFLVVFDFADRDVVRGRRIAANTPTQALYLLNSPFVRENARRAAERLIQETASNRQRIERMYRRLLGRGPNADEVQKCLSYLGAGEVEDWASLVQVLLASAEFRMLD